MIVFRQAFLNLYIFDVHIPTQFYLLYYYLKFQLLSHKAYYTLILDKTNINSVLEGGDGKSTYLFNKDCNGWSLKENFMIIYNLTNNKNAKSYSIFKSFEDYTSNNFSFEHFDKSDLSGEINYSGFVKKDGKKLNVPKKGNKELTKALQEYQNAVKQAKPVLEIYFKFSCCIIWKNI